LNFKEILELIDRVAERGIGGIEIEQAGTKLRIDGKPTQQLFASYVGGEVKSDPSPLPTAPLPALPAGPQGEPAGAGSGDESEAGVHVITSPIVGTFYRSPNPEAQVFVSVGDRVAKGAVLCIIEAMKLMNEIECDVDGVVASIYPQNGQPIEYGERLFGIKV
jgi:acetyl-CoA carboxylase biotin carboxyl carrier protein